MTHDEIIAILQAHKEGKVIEYTHFGVNAGWVEWNGNHIDTFIFDYRIKPEPKKPREWVVAYNEATGDVVGASKVGSFIRVSDFVDVCLVRVREVIEE